MDDTNVTETFRLSGVLTPPQITSTREGVCGSAQRL